MPVIPEEVRRTLELQYAPAQLLEPVETPQIQTHAPNGYEKSHPVVCVEPDAHHHDHAGRSLPKCPVSEENIGPQYAAFILYCNPTVPLDTNTTELKAIFQAPPKSDGKSFSTWTLFELIKKLEKKEIKTWAQLAIDLGVEPPVLEKGQSAQKVQQYAVRLKRWMHAMHVDAYFEYLMGKPHVYWTQVPAANEPLPENGRDGVAPEEDLALRALLPETRPKRGRRKNEDRDESELGKSPSQRPRIHSPTLSDDFMMARAAIMTENGPAISETSFEQTFPDRLVPWSAMEARGQLGAFRWPETSDNISTPLSAYPQSAITPSNRADLWSDEPRSAITPKSKARRRHGPAVSSAWPSNGATSSGKLRGRPPSNRSVTDGPFSTFPANPTAKDTPTVNLRDNTPAATPIVANAGVPHFFPPAPRPNPPNPIAQSSRPSRLSLQVPPREGGSVRLATPPPISTPTAPPVVLVNGEGDTDVQPNTTPKGRYVARFVEYFNSSYFQHPKSQNLVSFTVRQNEDTDDKTNMDALESHFICEILAAEWVNAAGEGVEKCSIEDAEKISKQLIKNLQNESGSQEALLINLSALTGGPLINKLKVTKLDHGDVTHFECHWSLQFGSAQGDFKIRVTIEPSTVESTDSEGGDEKDWKKKWLLLRLQVKERDAKMGLLKKGVLDALVESNRISKV